MEEEEKLGLPLDIERAESPNNNIYGTKDYYDYYKRLQP